MKKNNKDILFYFFKNIYFLFNVFYFEKSNNQSCIAYMRSFCILIKHNTCHVGSMNLINYNHENCCQLCIKNSFANVLEKCYFYYVYYVNQVANVLFDISLNKKKVYQNDFYLKKML